VEGLMAMMMSSSHPPPYETSSENIANFTPSFRRSSPAAVG
jgi:hypothetical protein